MTTSRLAVFFDLFACYHVFSPAQGENTVTKPNQTSSAQTQRTDIGFEDKDLGRLTSDEVLFMRQIPLGCTEAVWTRERLEQVRQILRRLGEV